MTNGAILAEIVSRVVGIIHPVVIILVAGPAVRGGARKLPVHMASGAVDRQMLAGKREAGKAVIKGGRAPSILVMALRAILRKTGVDMVGIAYGVIIVLVTTNTFPGQVILVVHMTIRAA